MRTKRALGGIGAEKTENEAREIRQTLVDPDASDRL